MPESHCPRAEPRGVGQGKGVSGGSVRCQAPKVRRKGWPGEAVRPTSSSTSWSSSLGLGFPSVERILRPHHWENRTVQRHFVNMRPVYARKTRMPSSRRENWGSVTPGWTRHSGWDKAFAVPLGIPKVTHACRETAGKCRTQAGSTEHRMGWDP